MSRSRTSITENVACNGFDHLSLGTSSTSIQQMHQYVSYLFYSFITRFLISKKAYSNACFHITISQHIFHICSRWNAVFAFPLRIYHISSIHKRVFLHFKTQPSLNLDLCVCVSRWYRILHVFIHICYLMQIENIPI